jgi:anaerobic ribonucleoside-triphosphate reductase activating protein
MVHEYNDPGCRLMSVLHLGSFLPRSEANGPGVRSVVWVQGCPHRCEGCFNPQFLPFSPARQVSTSGIARIILAQTGIEGVTFSGGEPFSQAPALAELGALVRDKGMTVITYSGYQYKHLKDGRKTGWQELLAVTDLLIAGPYVPVLRCTDSLKGSTNQEIIPLSGRIAVPAGEPEEAQGTGTAEFTISADGTITATGFPGTGLLDQLQARCRGV